jgi:ferritin
MEVLSPRILQGFNTQVGNELRNANIYLMIAAYFKDKALFNIAKIYQDQVEEERKHAQKFIDFIIDHRGELYIPAIDIIDIKLSALEAVKLALAAEVKTTNQIYNLVEIAQYEKNHIVYNFLLYFISEQEEELKSANDRLSIIERNKDNLELANMVFKDII